MAAPEARVAVKATRMVVKCMVLAEWVVDGRCRFVWRLNEDDGFQVVSRSRTIYTTPTPGSKAQQSYQHTGILLSPWTSTIHLVSIHFEAE
jgi:hypothetical protein